MLFKVTRAEAIRVGALIYRAHFGMDRSKFQNQQGLISQLIPDDVYADLKLDDWKAKLISAYSKQMGKLPNLLREIAREKKLIIAFIFLELSESECKLEFLKYLQQQQTFGSTFFVVKQRTVNSYPETLLIAINRNGFHILDPVKKVKYKGHEIML